MLSASEGIQLSAAALFRPHLAIGAIPVYSAIATLALADAIAADELCVTPVWPDQVTVEGETIGRIVVETAPAADRTSYVVLGADIDVRALEATRRGPFDWNVLVAAFLNALDKWATAYATRGPAAVRGAMRFLPRGPVPAARVLEGHSAR